jgi:CTP synthase (UTP-ammonia lyase)
VAVEFVRNVLGFRDADHAETSPDAETLVVTPLACSLVGKEEEIALVPGSLSASLYGGDGHAPQKRPVESYHCNYGLAPAWEQRFEASGLRVGARGAGGEVRVLELDDHPFFVATLFLPQLASKTGAPHPIVAAFARAANRA